MKQRITGFQLDREAPPGLPTSNVAIGSTCPQRRPHARTSVVPYSPDKSI